MTVLAIPRYFNPALQVVLLATRVEFANGQGLSVRFSVRRTMASTPDTCEIAIANLDPIRAQSMAALFSSTGLSTVTLRAGYDQLLSGLFAGTVRSFSSATRSGADLWTELAADDGGDAFTDRILQISNAGMTATQMIDVAATAMGLVLDPSSRSVLAQANPAQQGPFTAVMVGRASELLDAAARRIRCRWWTRDGKVFLGARGQPDAARPAVLIQPASLISEPSTDGSGLSRFEIFLDPNIVPGSQVAYGAARYRVEAVTHRGETRAGVWVSDVTGRILA